MSCVSTFDPRIKLSYLVLEAIDDEFYCRRSSGASIRTASTGSSAKTCSSTAGSEPSLPASLSSGRIAALTIQDPQNNASIDLEPPSKASSTATSSLHSGPVTDYEESESPPPECIVSRMAIMSVLPCIPFAVQLRTRRACLLAYYYRSLTNYTSDRDLQVYFACATGSAVVCGASGSVVGLTTGSIIGGSIGTPFAVATCGLSIPACAAVGGSIGFCTGAVGGASTGLIAGGAVGYGSRKKEKISTTVRNARSKTCEIFRSVGTLVNGLGAATGKFAASSIGGKPSKTPIDSTTEIPSDLHERLELAARRSNYRGQHTLVRQPHTGRIYLKQTPPHTPR